MDTLTTTCAVIDELNKRGIEANLEYPCYIVQGDWIWGTDEGFWLGQHVMDGEEVDGELIEDKIESTIPRDSTDVQAIADLIAWIAIEQQEVA